MLEALTEWDLHRKCIGTSQNLHRKSFRPSQDVHKTFTGNSLYIQSISYCYQELVVSTDTACKHIPNFETFPTHVRNEKLLFMDRQMHLL